MSFCKAEELEIVFQGIEQESERRALEEEEGASRSSFTQLHDPNALIKQHRRGSITVSRVGTYQDLNTSTDRHGAGSLSAPVSPTPWSSLLLNQGLIMYQNDNDSLSSLASNNSRNHHPLVEDNHTTQKETIGGRRNTITKAVGSIISKTLTRVRSRTILCPTQLGIDEPVVIGVSVEAKVEHHPNEADEDEGEGLDSVDHHLEPSSEREDRRSCASSSATGRLRSSRIVTPQVSGYVLRDNANTVSPGKSSSKKRKRSTSIVWMAKSFVQKIRRKSSTPMLIRGES